MDDCFTWQSPGNAISIPAAPDVHEWLGQIQASAPKGRAGRRLVGGEGMGASDRSWLMEVSPSVVLVPA